MSGIGVVNHLIMFRNGALQVLFLINFNQLKCSCDGTASVKLLCGRARLREMSGLALTCGVPLRWEPPAISAFRPFVLARLNRDFFETSGLHIRQIPGELKLRVVESD